MRATACLVFSFSYPKAACNSANSQQLLPTDAHILPSATLPTHQGTKNKTCRPSNTLKVPLQLQSEHAPRKTIRRDRSSNYVSHAQVLTSFGRERERERETERERDKVIGREEERERARWKDDNPGSPLPLPLLTCKQASATRREGVREESKRRLTRFRGLWSIKGLHVNSKTTPTISNSVVCVCVAVGLLSVKHVSLDVRALVFESALRVLGLTCGGIGAGTSGSCEQPGSVF